MEVNTCWVSHPQEWQPLFRHWHERRPERTALHVWEQFGGQQVVGLTIGTDVPSPSFRLIVTVAHAHEPAPTAAIVNVVSQLLTDCYLDGSPATLPMEQVLENSLLTFLPDTNSQGRARSPHRYWDGTLCDNEIFWKVAFGVASNNERFGRYPEWSFAEHRPKQIGIVYEQLDDDLYVESNTSRRSTHSQAIDALFERYGYTHMLDMHQHEWHECALLPAHFDDLSPSDQQMLNAWGNALIEAWKEQGATPCPEPYIPYKGQPRQQFFRDFWAERCPGMLELATEVRNNRLHPTSEPTPIAYQFRMATTALETTLLRTWL
jgi:hypothetical protein